MMMIFRWFIIKNSSNWHRHVKNTLTGSDLVTCHWHDDVKMMSNWHQNVIKLTWQRHMTKGHAGMSCDIWHWNDMSMSQNHLALVTFDMSHVDVKWPKVANGWPNWTVLQHVQVGFHLWDGDPQPEYIHDPNFPTIRSDAQCPEKSRWWSFGK